MGDTEDEHRGYIQAALTLQMTTLSMLVKKGILTWAEVKDAMDQATLSLEQEGLSNRSEAYAHKLLNQLMLSIGQDIEPLKH